MTRARDAVMLVCCVVGCGLLFVGPASFARTQQTETRACLHGPDETAGEKTRRGQALTYVRVINTAQTAFAGRNRRYAHFDELQDVQQAPPGFALQHAADSNGYLFSVKDTADPCGFALFSDQKGIIYQGAYIR